jgi:hypothetical protein
VGSVTLRPRFWSNFMMKKAVLMGLILGLVSGWSAQASPLCEAIKRGEGSSIERGVKVVEPVSKIEEYFWFGADQNVRDRAGTKCQEILAASSCTRTTPKASDQYMNVGDPGFGPRLYVKKSSEAGILHISLPGYSNLDGSYYAFYSGCEEARAKVALDAVEEIQYQYQKAKCVAEGFPEWTCPWVLF